eukprot:TRINITY_DN16474_c0_g1_i1.p2 TRINITY_DN16474_c0_g1~~TRINITY_DN16474_c0_g1_i1.p2  ORF type:complete len:148 (+),score=20.90 TRINITY_DN16474_c0_g1_i1:51-494(+)
MKTVPMGPIDLPLSLLCAKQKSDQFLLEWMSREETRDSIHGFLLGEESEKTVQPIQPILVQVLKLEPVVRCRITPSTSTTGTFLERFMHLSSPTSHQLATMCGLPFYFGNRLLKRIQPESSSTRFFVLSNDLLSNLKVLRTTHPWKR